MEFLRVLEGLRTPALDTVLTALTQLGDETVFMILAIVLFWCVSKRVAYYVFAVGLGGTVANQWLKLIFRIPRPWVLDPSFTIVESARAAATGYSFPSGHTQNIVGTMACLIPETRNKVLRGVCIALIILVPFSRMYLGVHTPLDVGVSFVLALALALALRPFFRDEERFRRAALPLLLALIVFGLCYLLWVLLTRFPADVDPDNLAHGVKNGWTLLGAMLGLLTAWFCDGKRLHFSEKAPLPGQIAKAVLGLALLLGIRAGLKPLLNALTGGALWANAVRYYCMVVFAGCVWPLTFPYFAKLGEKHKEN